eukprot:2249147-Amphidinium_carterae.3
MQYTHTSGCPADVTGTFICIVTSNLPKEGKEQLKEMEASEQSPQNRAFILESVETEQNVECKVTKSYVVLDDYEYEKAFGSKPRAKDPKCSKVTLPDVDGTLTSFWVFQDPEQPFRKMQLTSSLGEVKRQELLTKDEHLHKQQADSTHSSKSKTRLESSGVASLLDRRLLHNLSTVGEFQVNLKNKNDMMGRGCLLASFVTTRRRTNMAKQVSCSKSCLWCVLGLVLKNLCSKLQSTWSSV